jgi:hypothetical protein
MSIRSLGLIAAKDIPGDPGTFMNQFREDLFRLGAFGFDNWRVLISTLSRAEADAKPRDVKEIRLIRFTDTSDVIAVKDDNFLIADGAFESLLTDIGLKVQPNPPAIDGIIAQLGDFKIRYGLMKLGARMAGIVLDVEYLPVRLLSADFSMLFNSVAKLMTSAPVYFSVPAPAGDTEFSLFHLGKQYQDLLAHVASS